MDYRKVYTPPEIARLLVQLAEPKPELVWLEPSAGVGNIASQIPKHGIIHCVEKDPEAFKELERTHGYLGGNQGFNTTFCDDFLTMDFRHSRYNRIVANPPFTDGDEYDKVIWHEHILKMYSLMSYAGVLVSIIPASYTIDAMKAMAYLDSEERRYNCKLGAIPYTNWFKPEKFPIQILKIVKN